MITGSKAGTVEGYGGRRTWRSHLAGLRRLDMPLLLAVVALSVVGALLVRSATFQLLTEQGKDPEGFLKRHILNLVIGFVLGGVVTLLDYRLLRAYVPILYGVACVGLVAVLTPLGDTINGSHSWIVLGGGFQVQPSEFAKVGLVVLLAMILGEPRDGEIGPGRRDVLLALVLAGVRPCSSCCSRTSAPRWCSSRWCSACWPSPARRSAGCSASSAAAPPRARRCGSSGC